MKKTFTIEWIHCNSCVALISMDLEDLSGIQDIEICNQTGKTTIEYDEEKVSWEDIVKSIEGSGEYEVSESSEGSEQPEL